MQGELIGISRRPAHRAPSEHLESIGISTEHGVEGDHKGQKFKRRQVSVLALEDWQAALTEIGADPETDWMVRRANLLVSGLELPRSVGSILSIGPVGLEVTDETVPCGRMDEAIPGLRRALAPHWRGGVTCRVLTPGTVAVGEVVTVTHRAPVRTRRLP